MPGLCSSKKSINDKCNKTVIALDNDWWFWSYLISVMHDLIKRKWGVKLFYTWNLISWLKEGHGTYLPHLSLTAIIIRLKCPVSHVLYGQYESIWIKWKDIVDLVFLHCCWEHIWTLLVLFLSLTTSKSSLSDQISAFLCCETLLVKWVAACLIALHDSEHLNVLGQKTRWQQAMDAQLEPLFQGECHALQDQNHAFIKHINNGCRPKLHSHPIIWLKWSTHTALGSVLRSGQVPSRGETHTTCWVYLFLTNGKSEWLSLPRSSAYSLFVSYC